MKRAPAIIGAGSAERGAGERRFRYGLRAAVIALCATAALLFVSLIAARLGWSADLTVAGSHRLSPWTRDLLARLDGPYDVVVAANFSTLDPIARDQTRDALDAMAAASQRVRVWMIDTGAGTGGREYTDLLAGLVERSGDRIAAVRAVLDAAVAECRAQADSLRRTAVDLTSARDCVGAETPAAATVRSFLENKAAVARVTAEELEAAAKRSEEASRRTVGPVAIPPLDEMERALTPALASLADECSSTSKGLAAIADEGTVAPAAREKSAEIARAVTAMRDAVARRVETLRALKPLPVLAVARTLEHQSAALIVGPDDARGQSRVTAVDLDSLYPAVDRASGMPVPNLRARTEEIVANGIASLLSADRPVVVLVHGEGIRIAPGFEPFQQMARRLSLRGMELLEWAAALDAEPPPLASAGTRPVVYVTVATNADSPEGAVRMKKLADAVNSLLEGGAPVLVSVGPSSLPGIGESDPMVAGLKAIGLDVDSGRPVVQSVNTARGRAVSTDFLLVPDGRSDERLVRAIAGLPVHLMWPVPVRPAPSTTLSDNFTPLLTIAADPSTWAESEWRRLRATPVSQRDLMTDPPSLDSQRDDGKGPWYAAAAVWRPVGGAVAGGRAKIQRIVVVGSNGWFLDAVTQQAQSVDGRIAPVCPGNLELLEAGVTWLAGQDEWIGRSAPAGAVPLIRPLTAGQVQAIRWVLIAGLPLMVLALGAALRLLRG